MARKIGLLIGGVLLVVGLFAPVQAAGSPWRAWLYENEIGRMTRLDDSGATLEQLMLPADPGSAFSYHAAVSQDGARVAYVASTPAGATLTLYDLNLRTMVGSLSLPLDAYHSLDFAGSWLNFSEGNGSFAFGYAHPSVGWQIQVVNLTTFDLFILEPSSPAAVAAGIDAGFGFLVPVVQSNRAGRVQFTMIPAATEGAPVYRAYTWDPGSSLVSPNDAYVTLGVDTFPLTGETVMPLSDDRFIGATDPMTGFWITNTIQVYAPAQGRFPWYLASSAAATTRFIQNGERIAAAIQMSSDGPFYWQILERSSMPVATLMDTPMNNLTSAAGLLNGFIFTRGSSGRSGGTTLYYVETRLVAPPFTPVSVWNSSLGADARIVWVSDNDGVGAGPFMPWGSLAVLGEPPVMPTVPPVALVLTVGGQAMVQTTAGDTLNVRSGPGRSFARLGVAASGTVVTLLEGPFPADGLTWWRIRLPSGTEGWVVDFADGVQTLLPR